MRLDAYRSDTFNRGASRVREAAWIILAGLLFTTWLPGSTWRIWILRAFGAQIGEGVIIKPKVQIKFPWKLTIGDHCWIGEKAWIDNLAEVVIGNHVCISQGAYLCTGSHDWKATGFDLITKPIRIGDHAWVAAWARVSPGVTVSEGAVLAFASAATSTLSAWTVYRGVPAVSIASREVNARTQAGKSESERSDGEKA